jgi:hypothetical protein
MTNRIKWAGVAVATGAALAAASGWAAAWAVRFVNTPDEDARSWDARSGSLDHG